MKSDLLLESFLNLRECVIFANTRLRICGERENKRISSMNYDGTCQAPWIVDCDCDTCRGYYWVCPDCGARHNQSLPECEECDWVAPEHAEQAMQDYLIGGQFDAAAKCWLATESANVALEKKLLEINKSGGEALMCQLKEVARIAFAAGLEANQP